MVPRPRSTPSASFAVDEHAPAFGERARLRARRELLEAQRQRLHEVRAFEQRLATLRPVPGWRYVRSLRQRFLQGVVRPQERLFAFLLLHQKALVYEIRMRGDHVGTRHWILAGAYWTLLAVPYAVLLGLVWIQNRIYAGLIRSERLFARGVVVLPSTLQTGYAATVTELRRKQGVRGLRRAILEEGYLTPERRQALLFLAAVIGLGAWVLSELLLRLLDPNVLPFKHHFDLLFIYGFATRLFLPTPLELLLPSGADVLGASMAVFVAALGSLVGTWVLYLVGDKANQGLDKFFDRWPWTRKAWSWVERNAERFGYALMGGLLAIPFAPDSLTALFAVLGLRLRWFLATAFAATILRLTIFLLLWP